MIYAVAGAIAAFSWFMPWWWIGLPTAYAGFHSKNYLRSFAVGFFATAIVWILFSYYFDLKSAGLMSDRLSQLFSLPMEALIFLVVGIIGGLYGGLAAMTGHAFRPVFDEWN